MSPTVNDVDRPRRISKSRRNVAWRATALILLLATGVGLAPKTVEESGEKPKKNTKTLAPGMPLRPHPNAGAPRPTPRVPGLDHVIVIGVDGLSIDGVKRGAGENLHRLMNEGAFTLAARGNLPTVSAPNWASIISGASPAQHGVTDNDWLPDQHDIEPTVHGPGGIFPTMFSVLWEQDPTAVTAVFHDWIGFAWLVERDEINVVQHGKDAADATTHACDYLKANKPRLLFLHLDLVDHAGHKHGWGGPEYITAVGAADAQIGRVLAAIKEANLEKSTMLIVVADHGGKGTKHGGNTMDELEVPWIAWGAGIAPGREIKSPVNSYDTAATIVHALGLKPPAAWIGKPVAEALGGE